MAWIESHQGLERHPKLLTLATKLNTDRYGAIGRLHCLWYWCLEYAPDGDLRKFDSQTIEKACDIPLETLASCNFVDCKPFLRIHDWWDYAGRFIQNKFKNYPKKWMQIKKLYKGSPRGTPKGDPKTVDQPYQPTNHTYTDFLQVWEENKGRLPGIKEFSDDRKAAFSRLFREKPDMSYWKAVVQRLAASDFACGEGKDGWKATVDFLLRKWTHVRIMEGKYDNRPHANKMTVAETI